jgi:hypothetical protein
MIPAFIIFLVTAVPIKAVNVIGWDHRGALIDLIQEYILQKLLVNQLAKKSVFYEIGLFITAFATARQ